MNLFFRIVRSVYREVVKPKSHVMGEEFENYIRKRIFTKHLYDIEHRSHDYSVNNGDFIGETFDPDFVFADINSEKIFFVEAKYRSYFYDDAVEWCKKYQYDRYLEYNKDLPVFIALGVGGKPKSPDHLYVFPIKHIKYTRLFKKTLKKYELDPTRKVRIDTIWNFL